MKNDDLLKDGKVLFYLWQENYFSEQKTKQDLLLIPRVKFH